MNDLLSRLAEPPPGRPSPKWVCPCFECCEWGIVPEHVEWHEQRTADLAVIIELAKKLRSEVADYKAMYNSDYDHFENGYVAGLEKAADLLDGDL